MQPSRVGGTSSPLLTLKTRNDKSCWKHTVCPSVFFTSQRNTLERIFFKVKLPCPKRTAHMKQRLVEASLMESTLVIAGKVGGTWNSISTPKLSHWTWHSISTPSLSSWTAVMAGNALNLRFVFFLELNPLPTKSNAYSLQVWKVLLHFPLDGRLAMSGMSESRVHVSPWFFWFCFLYFPKKHTGKQFPERRATVSRRTAHMRQTLVGAFLMEAKHVFAGKVRETWNSTSTLNLWRRPTVMAWNTMNRRFCFWKEVNPLLSKSNTYNPQVWKVLLRFPWV